MEFGENLLWWVGIVERRDDKTKIGRCKVRIAHIHPADKTLVPTDDLPWAYPSEPLNGTFFSTPYENDRVFGFFADGREAQEPVMVGKFATALQQEVGEDIIEKADAEETDIGEDDKGFKDARTDAELTSYPRQYMASRSFAYDGSGITKTEYGAASRYPVKYAVFTEEGLPSTPHLARNDKPPEQLMLFPRADNIPTALKGTTWSEPPTAYKAVYPLNKVYESESKHAMEFDDTPGAERVRIMHRTGTQFEYLPNGSAITKIVKHQYSLILGDDNVVVYGKCNITVMGDANVYVKGDMNHRIDGSYNLRVGKDFKTWIGGDQITNTTGNSKYGVNGEFGVKAGGTMTLVATMLLENPSSGYSVPLLTGAAFE